MHATPTLQPNGAAVQNLEVSIVGDFDPQQLEELALQLLGTLHRDPPAQMPAARPVELQQVAMRDRRMVWHLKDSDERADGVIAGGSRFQDLQARAQVWGFGV